MEFDIVSFYVTRFFFLRLKFIVFYVCSSSRTYGVFD